MSKRANLRPGVPVKFKDYRGRTGRGQFVSAIRDPDGRAYAWVRALPPYKRAPELICTYLSRVKAAS